MKPRHLAIFLPSLDGGGAERVMLTLAGRFVARGVRCDLVIASSKGQLLEQVPSGVRLVPLGKRKASHAVFALARFLRQEKPQTLLSTIFPANIAALAASMSAAPSCRIVLREANQTNHDLKRRSVTKTWLNRIAARLLYPRADAAVAVAESVGRGLIECGLVAPSKVHVIRNPAKAHTATPDKLSERPIPPLLLSCGRLEPQKDHATLLRAFARVRTAMDAKLMLLGEGSLLTQLKHMAAALGIVNDVVFAGFDNAPQLRMQQANVLVLSSRFEGMSNVLIEALGAGCPIVATDCPGGTREVLADGKFGTLVPVGDDAAMADAILQVLMGEVTFPDPSEHLRQFDIEQVTDAYLSVLFPDDNHKG